MYFFNALTLARTQELDIKQFSRDKVEARMVPWHGPYHTEELCREAAVVAIKQMIHNHQQEIATREAKIARLQDLIK